MTSRSPQETASVFVHAVLDHDDLPTAWSVADIPLRRGLADAWVTLNAAHPSIRARGQDNVARALADGDVDHPLWPHFALAVLEEFHDAWSNVDTSRWGWASGPRPVELDTELVLFVDRTGLPDGLLPKDVLRPALTLLMRYDESRWIVAALPGPEGT